MPTTCRENRTHKNCANAVLAIALISACEAPIVYSDGLAVSRRDAIICGSNDMQPTTSYNGSLGVSIQFVSDRKSRIGQLVFAGGVQDCTATILDGSAVITAGHCVHKLDGSLNLPSSVHFYDRIDGSFSDDFFSVTSLIEDRIGGLDYAILGVTGNPEANFGKIEISAGSMAVGAHVVILGFPFGTKKVSAGAIGDVSGSSYSYDADTEQGNSGAVVLGDNGMIYGVHGSSGSGNCSGGTGNAGVKTVSILDVSPWMRATIGRAAARNHVLLF